ncbi:MAG: AAA family ATPase [Spirochaetia bacterium]
MKPVEVQALHNKLLQSVETVFVGKENEIELLFIGFLSGLHVLLEDIPGVGKTTLSRTIAISAGMDFGRIQFTPDLLPGDITGMTVWSQKKRDFVFKTGAIMHQFILADEINRASARTQASMLEGMQEHAVTVDGVTYKLPSPFFVIATQNPSSFAGTFLLPEAQVDRFGVSISLGYPNPQEEDRILHRFQESNPIHDLTPVSNTQEITEAQKAIHSVFVSPQVRKFVIDIAQRTRSNEYVRLGMSPRASRHLLLAAQSKAAITGRDFVIPEDVVAVTPSVLSHRLILTPEARLNNRTAKQIIDSILDKTPIPSGT